MTRRSGDPSRVSPEDKDRLIVRYDCGTNLHLYREGAKWSYKWEEKCRKNTERNGVTKYFMD